MLAQAPDYGEVHYPGWFGRFLGRLPKIVRDANFAAAMESLPTGSKVVSTDPNRDWILYETADGQKVVRFQAAKAWFPNEPTLIGNGTKRTGAVIHSDGRVIVTEGLHRTRATARERTLIGPEIGCAVGVPGWLDFAFDPEAMRDTPSSRAISLMLGGDPDAPFVSAQ